MSVVYTVVALLILTPSILVAQTPLTLLFLSDMHYDPFFGQQEAFAGESRTCLTSRATLGSFGCDSPRSLLQSTLLDITNVARPDYVIVAGDWERHDSIPAAADTTFKTLAEMVSNLTLKVVPCPGVSSLGNNDFVPDYWFNVSAPTSPALLNASTHLANNGMLDATENHTFAMGGYYARRIVNVSLTLLILNTLVWTKDLLPATATSADPLGQLAFARSVLQAATSRGDKVIIIGHIPPTINFFDAVQHSTNRQKAENATYILPYYEMRYARLIREFREAIVLQVFAHTHRFSFSAAQDMGNVPMIVLGAISPVYGNNPNYFLASYDPAIQRISWMRQRGLPISASGDKASWRWGHMIPRDYTGDSEATIGSEFMDRVGSELSWNVSARRIWNAMYAGGAADPCDAFCWRLASCTTRFAAPPFVFHCAFQNVTRRGACLETNTVELFVALFITLAVVAVALAIRRRRLRARAGFVAVSHNKSSTVPEDTSDKIPQVP